MSYKKYNGANNAFATLAFPIADDDLTLVLAGKFGRMPTSNFILKVTHTESGVITGRENIYVATRSGATCTGLIRAYEPVPTDDDATTNIQQALNFSAGDLCEVVISSEVIKDMQDNLASQVSIQNQSYSYVADTGAANAYVITLSPAITEYVAGQKFSFKVSNSNSGTSTLNVNGLGVKTIKKTGGTSNLASGDIVAGQIVEVVYDGTDFEMQTPVPVTIPTDSFILGEGCAAGDALAIEQIPYSLSATSQINFGNATATQFQGFRLIGNGVAMTTLSVVLKKILAPADNCIIAIQADSAGSPSGVDLATATIAGGTITTSLAEYNPTLSSSVTPADGTYYWVICRRSGVLDASNYYQIGINAQATVAFGYKTNNAGAWGALIQTNSFPIRGLGFYSEVAVRAKATLQKFSTIRLYSPSALSVFGKVSKSISDIYSGLAGLKLGIPYFLSNTAGAISLTQGTIQSYAGEAKAADSIRLGKRIIGNTKVTTTDNVASTSLTPGTTYFTDKGGLLVGRTVFGAQYGAESQIEYSKDAIAWTVLANSASGSANSGNAYPGGNMTAMIEPGFYRSQQKGLIAVSMFTYMDLYEYDIL